MSVQSSSSSITMEEGWPILQDGINKLIDLVEGVKKSNFTSYEYINLYTTVYKICQTAIAPECGILYERHSKIYEDYISSRIDRDRNEEGIDRVLVKSVIDMYLEIGEACYEKDFEEEMLKSTLKFYSLKASNWIISIESYQDYMFKVEECLKQEKERAESYLQKRTEMKLLEVVEYELMTVHAMKLEEKKHAS